MRAFLLIATATVSLATATSTAPTTALAGERSLNGREILRLMSGQSVTGWSYRRSARFAARFSPTRDVKIDAGLISLAGIWRVSGDRLCVRFPSLPSENQCGAVVQVGQNAYEIRDGGRPIQRFSTQ